MQPITNDVNLIANLLTNQLIQLPPPLKNPPPTTLPNPLTAKTPTPNHPQMPQNKNLMQNLVSTHKIYRHELVWLDAIEQIR